MPVGEVRRPFDVGRESPQCFPDFIRGKSSPDERAIEVEKLLGVVDRVLGVVFAEFAPKLPGDHLVLVGVLVRFFDRTLDEVLVDSAAAQVGQDTAAAEPVVFLAEESIGVGKSLVVEVPGLGEAGEDVFGVFRPRSAAGEAFANFVDGE